MKKCKHFISTLVSCFFIATVLFVASCKKENQGKNLIESQSLAKKINPRQGFVYTESNDAGQNSILSYLQKPNGTLSFLSTTASGGKGSGTPLGSQGALAMDDGHHWLFAVNAGSNSISSFSIDEGSLTLAHTVQSNGILPVSLTVYGNVLYVVNSTSANISGFTIGTGGTLTLIPGSGQPLSAATAAPAQISFKPGGQWLVVTEKMTNKITTFPVDAAGVAGAGSSIASANITPFGFDFSGNSYAIVTEAAGGAPTASTVSSYWIGSTSSLVSGPVHADQTAACWLVTTADGKYAYATNTGSNTISSFSVSNNGSVQILSKVAATTGGAPADVTLSGNEFYLYTINGGSHSISEFKKGNNTSLKNIGEITGLPAAAAGLVAF
jgi:6-phosphogluconolactonase (cycloisomerase 2 family)